MESFEELGLEEEMMAAMREAGISKLIEIQCVGVHAVLERRRNWLRWIVRIEFELVNGLEELTIAAPALELLWWSDAFDPSYALFGDVRVLCLQQLSTFAIPVYGRYDYTLLLDYVMLLRHFPVVSRLDLRLNYERLL